MTAKEQAIMRVNRLIVRLRRVEQEVRKIRGNLQWVPAYLRSRR